VISRLFGVGISGPELTPSEREILDRHPPRGVILFRRNIETPEQTSRLVAELSARGLLVFLDQEGGPVDRLRDLLGPSISFREAAARGLARRAGELAGESCARFGFAVDLAPVVDRRIEGASAEVLRDRCAGEDPAAVARAAREFLRGLHSRGVGGCLKHFPGLGRAALDTHLALPKLPENATERARDLEPFRRLAGGARAVMISHAAGRDGVPASLSGKVGRRLLRGRLRFRGVAFSDDLEMGALAAFGDLPRRALLAGRAGCDLIFVCSRIAEYPDCVAAVGEGISQRRAAEALARMDRYTAHLARLRRRRRPPRPMPALIAAIARLKTVDEHVRGREVPL
jgi:beta-N-acetylhexosaminidase